MKIIKLPRPTRLIFGSLGAFWLAVAIHPGFNSVGIIILLLIPVLIFELFYPQQEMQQLLNPDHPAAFDKTVSDKSNSRQLRNKQT